MVFLTTKSNKINRYIMIKDRSVNFPIKYRVLSSDTSEVVHPRSKIYLGKYEIQWLFLSIIEVWCA